MIFRREPSQFMILVDGDDNEGEVDAASLIVAKSIKADMNTVYTKRFAYSTKLTLDGASQFRNAVNRFVDCLGCYNERVKTTDEPATCI